MAVSETLCQFCKAPVPESVTICPECGFDFQPKQPKKGPVELSDAQIIALAGFEEARYDAEKRHAPKQKMPKAVSFVLFGIVLPTLASFLIKTFHPFGLDIPDLKMGGTLDSVLKEQRDASKLVQDSAR